MMAELWAVEKTPVFCEEWTMVNFDDDRERMERYVEEMTRTTKYGATHFYRVSKYVREEAR